MPQATCDTCGASIDGSARFCPECGVRRAPAPAPAEIRTFGKPPSAPALGLGRRLAAFRTRGRAVVETINTQARARRQVLAIRLELEQLARVRDLGLRDLGIAVYDEDAAGTERGRAAIRDLDERIAAKETEMTQVAEQTYERVEQVRAQARPTELLEPPAPTPPEPYPPTIPEPYPPPDEGNPPSPAPVPEPYPPPDEADPPRRI